MKLLVKKYLQNHSLNQLEKDHGVKSRFNDQNDKFSLNYNQIKMINGDLLAEQCRGLILRPHNNNIKDHNKDHVVGEISILAWPLNRFYNLGEEKAAAINWSDSKLKVFEKLDGTMCILYWDDLHDKWYVATRSVSEANLPIQQGCIINEEISFTSLFWKAFEETILRNEPDNQDKNAKQIVNDCWNKDLTYVFELNTPLNRIVVKYDDYQLTLLAVRNIITGVEIMDDKLSLPGIKWPKTWASLNEPNSLIEFVNKADPAKLEGCVVLDSEWRRIKVKNKAWVLSAKAKDMISMSKRNALLAIVDGTIDDIIPLIETDISDQIIKMKYQLTNYIRRVDKTFNEIKLKANGNRREFANLVKKSNDWATPYFQLFDGKSDDMSDWLITLAKNKKLTPSALEIIIKLL